MGRVEDKVALITGAARGQGRSHAVRLAQEGADVVVTDVCHDISDELPYSLASKEELAETVELVRATGRRCVAVQADVRSITEMRAAVDAAHEEFGRLDVVVANAGVMSAGSAWQLSEEAWDVVVDVNLKGAWNTARAAIPRMIEAGEGGSIIMISSAAGIRGHVPYAHYVAAKHGVVGLMKALSNELGTHGIRVNTVHPTGVSDTGITVGVPLDELKEREPMFALAAMNTHASHVEPRDVSNAVLFLASEEARYVTGLQFTVDAGSTNKP
ncbi:mycofactocin-coupled SDR family oxidoreductase [Streptomyces sp. WI04-05B]|uniref:mycofactocin-coupled SDR family oxidoreductase n=1 Tax=Streptomyces TaxID=1883 RepID=UPI0029ABD544|nr:MULTISPECIES: mycofactocin-coupled SDR family oxidoreductase [unclassified Streptomyces]MDX2545052.1 mycofactocin-coupled SDR family oxidoreductase [Streptomyces sp. WI04-05B]MDX2587543.1 mycofactocin-coupled SDR family oxidoreductase [Streptomyces sp. WI04-05A]